MAERVIQRVEWHSNSLTTNGVELLSCSMMMMCSLPLLSILRKIHKKVQQTSRSKSSLNKFKCFTALTHSVMGVLGARFAKRIYASKWEWKSTLCFFPNLIFSLSRLCFETFIYIFISALISYSFASSHSLNKMNSPSEMLPPHSDWYFECFSSPRLLCVLVRRLSYCSSFGGNFI